MKVGSRSFLESICTPESKSIRGRVAVTSCCYSGMRMSLARMPLHFVPICHSEAIKPNTHFHCLNKMNKKLGTRIPDCLVDLHEPE
jgi:hypothetical protein